MPKQKVRSSAMPKQNVQSNRQQNERGVMKTGFGTTKKNIFGKPVKSPLLSLV